MQSNDRNSWRHPRVMSLLLLVFLSGALAGAITFRFVRVRPAPPTVPAHVFNRDAALAKFRKELNLTPEQAKQVGLVLDDYKMFYQNLQEQLDEVRATGKTRILQILDPQQKQKLEKLLAELPK